MKEITNQKRRGFVLGLGKVMGAAGVVGISGIAPQTFAKGRSANLKSVSVHKGTNGRERLVFALDRSVRHKISTLTSPDRVVIDFIDTSAKIRLKIGRNSSNINQKLLVKNLRQATRNTKDFRVVLDMNEKSSAASALKSNDKGYFLEVALSPSRARKTPQQEIKKAISAVTAGVVRKPMTIAIDAGHGGRDPGAVGKKGTKEKHIALQIAKRLKRKIDRQPGMKGVLIRDGDYYLSLRKRINKARKHRADLFISIHADANPNPRLTGSSVYILSQKGASSEAAKWLANSENSYENRMAGADLHRGNKVVSSLLLDLSLADTIDRSHEIARDVLKELGTVNDLLRHQVESAGFVVLKSPDIPSVLVETAFISNPREEKRLKTAKHQEKLATAIFKGLRRYQVASLNRDDETQYS
ncbi:MAG: N-acetylmuramoyl-L-alanine amidase [Cocleimonas sp.]|jgi:N-acetylmuramoyl-L-alanine amidase